MKDIKLKDKIAQGINAPWVYFIMYTCMDSCIFLATAVYFR